MPNKSCSLNLVVPIMYWALTSTFSRLKQMRSQTPMLGPFATMMIILHFPEIVVLREGSICNGILIPQIKEDSRTFSSRS